MYDFVLSDLQTYAKLHQGNVGIIERTLVSERKKRFGKALYDGEVQG